MPARDEPPYGVRTISWPAIHGLLYPLPPGEELGYEPHGDEEAAEMQRLRGLVIVQAAETEAVLRRTHELLTPAPPPKKLMAGQLRVALMTLLTAEQLALHATRLQLIEQAIRTRNRVVHATVTIGYAQNGSDPDAGWTSVLSLMGDEETDELDLTRFLALQQHATAAAVEMYHQIEQSLPWVVREPTSDEPADTDTDWSVPDKSTPDNLGPGEHHPPVTTECGVDGDGR